MCAQSITAPSPDPTVALISLISQKYASGAGPADRPWITQCLLRRSNLLTLRLSIYQSIIDAHGGKLWADVNAPRGALFQFTLPGEEEELINCLPAARQTGETTLY